MSEIANLLTMATMVLADTVPSKVQGIYLFGQTADNAASVLERGVRAAMDKDIKLAVCGAKGNGYD